MNHPELPVSAHAEVADLVQLDSRGRARRPDGSMMKAGELAAIKAFQEDIREGEEGLHESVIDPQDSQVEISEIVPHVVKHRTDTRTWVTRDAGPAKHYKDDDSKVPGKYRNWGVQPDSSAVTSEGPAHRAFTLADDMDTPIYLAALNAANQAQAPRPRVPLAERLEVIRQTAVEAAANQDHTPRHRGATLPERLEAIRQAAVETANQTPTIEPVAATPEPAVPEVTPELTVVEPENIEPEAPLVVAAEAAADQQPTPIVDPSTLASLMKGKDNTRPEQRRGGFFERLRSRGRKFRNGAVLLATGAGRRPQEQRDPEALQKRNDRVMPVLVAIGAVALLAVAAKVGSHDSHSTILDLVPKSKGGHGGHHGYDVVAGKSLSPKHAHAGVLQHSPKHVTLRKGDNDWTTSRHELGSHASVAQVNQVDHAIMHLNHQTEESARHLAVGTKVKLPVKMIANIRKTLRH